MNIYELQNRRIQIINEVLNSNYGWEPRGNDYEVISYAHNHDADTTRANLKAAAILLKAKGLKTRLTGTTLTVRG